MAGKEIPEDRTVMLPLWLYRDLWWPPPQQSRRAKGPLQALFAGKINVRKGVPYLLRAVEQLGGAVALSLVGTRDPELDPLLGKGANVRVLPPHTKRELRELYWQHDVLILPSLGDSFGFVALEAMACGLPIIVTENCGVPVPSPDWRIAVMDSQAIAARLALYAECRELLSEHGQLATEFARQFTPEAYRRKAAALFRSLLN